MSDAAPEPSLRLLHVAESYPPDYGGGAGIVIHDVCHALAERGHQVSVLCTESRDGETYDTRSDSDGPIEVRRVNLPYLKSRDPEGWELGLREWRVHERRIAALVDREVERQRPELVCYNATRPLGEEGAISLHRHGLPVMAWLHEAWQICTRLMLLRSPTAEACSGPGPAKCLECMYSHYDGGHAAALLKLSWRVPRIGPYFAYRVRRRLHSRRALIG